MSDGKIIIAVTIPAGLILVVAVWFVLHHGSDDGSAQRSRVAQVDAETKPPVMPGETALRNQVSQLEAQNRQLSAELARRQQAEAQGQAADASKVGEIEGAAWVIREGGQSDIVRGLNVCILPTTCPRATVVLCLTDAISDIEAVESELRKIAPSENGVAELESRVAAIRIQMRQLPEEMDIIQAAELVKKFALWAPQTTHLFDLARTQIRTGVDGKYRIPGVQPGGCVIAAQSGDNRSKVYNIQWFVPVTMNPSGHVQLDLDNSNAFSISNAPTIRYN